MDHKDYLYRGVLNNEETDMIFEDLCFGDIIYLRKSFENMLQDIQVAVELDNRKSLVEGVVKRLNYLGCSLEASDVEGILKELKERYKHRIGTSVPRTVKEWIRGTIPGNVNRRNNYELCYALEMNVHETAEFFIKNYLSVPYNYKDITDAIFYYCLLNNKKYEVINDFIEKSKGFISNDSTSSNTVEIGRNIAEIDSDEEFLKYISQHCYNNEQQYQVARNKIRELVEEIKSTLVDVTNEDRVINLIVDTVFGFSYQLNIQRNLKVNQSKTRYVMDSKLPKRFVESIPRNGVLGDIIKGKQESYETLRKTLVILYFYTFFYDMENIDEENIRNNALDFYEEVNELLFEVGFAPVYVRHPFDYLMMFCALSPEPIETFRELNSYRYTEV